MRIFQTVIKKIIAAGGGNGFVASVVNAGIQLTNRFGLTAVEIKPAVVVDASRQVARIDQTPAVQTSLLDASGAASVSVNPAAAVSMTSVTADASSTPQNPALSIVQSLREWLATSFLQTPAVQTSLLGATGDAAKPAVNMAPAHTAVIQSQLTPQTPAGDIVQVVYNLTRRVGGDAVTETAVGGRTDWASDANAISGTDGLHDAAVATFAGSALGARGGQLELDYANSVNKSELTITTVNLHFYGRVFNTSMNNADVQLKWTKTGTFTTLETITGNADFRTTPKTHDITASITGWADIDALRTAVSASAVIAELWQAELDAVELEIIATRTDSL